MAATNPAGTVLRCSEDVANIHEDSSRRETSSLLFEAAARPSTLSMSTKTSEGAGCAILDAFPQLNITNQNKTALATVKGTRNPGSESLPVEWVVDVADKDNDWFVATAYSFNEAQGTVHVMVPDRDAPSWEGDVIVNAMALRLLECCDGKTMGLFKRLLRGSALEIDWKVRLHPPNIAQEVARDGDTEDDHQSRDSKDRRRGGGRQDIADASRVSPRLAPPAAVRAARATLLLSLGNYVVMEIGDCDQQADVGMMLDADESWGNAEPPDSEVKHVLMRLDERIELVECIGGTSEEAFYRLAGEGLVSYDRRKVHWRAFQGTATTRRRNERRRGSLESLSCPSIAALIATMEKADATANGSSMASVLKDAGAAIRILARRTLDLRDELLAEHLATLARFRRFVWDGTLEDGAAVMDQAADAHLGVLDDKHANDGRRIAIDAEDLERVLLAVADKIAGLATPDSGLRVHHDARGRICSEDDAEALVEGASGADAGLAINAMRGDVCIPPSQTLAPSVSPPSYVSQAAMESTDVARDNETT